MKKNKYFFISKIFKYAKHIIIGLVISICFTAIFTIGTEHSSEVASFLGGAIAGVVGFWSAFLIVEQNKYLEEERGIANILEQVKYIILSINRDFENIDRGISDNKVVEGFRKYQLYSDSEILNKYKISKNVLGHMNLINYIYDKEWWKNLSYIRDFNDKKVISDFMIYIETFSKEEVDTIPLYIEIVKVIEVIIKYSKYNIYDEKFENFGYRDKNWIRGKYFNIVKLKLKSIYNKFNLGELENREKAIKIDKDMIKFARKQLDRREKELRQKEKELHNVK